MSLTCSLEARPFQGLVNGLHKRLFCGDAQYTNDLVAGQLYGGLGMDRAEIDLEISAMEQVRALSLGSVGGGLLNKVLHFRYLWCSYWGKCPKKTGIFQS
jgi:hypothetical protein